MRFIQTPSPTSHQIQLLKVLVEFVCLNGGSGTVDQNKLAIWTIGYTKRYIYIVNVILKGQNMEYRRITDNEIDKALDLSYK